MTRASRNAKARRRARGCALATLTAIAAMGLRSPALGAQPSVTRASAVERFRPSIPRHPLFQASPGDKQRATPRPQLEPARIAGEVLAGAYAGIAGYFFGNWAGGMLAGTLPTASDGTREQIAFAGGIAGAALTTAASVAFIGDIGDQTGSYPAALAGTAGGIAAGLLLNQLLYGHARLPTEHGSSRVRWIEASLEAMLPAIGATIAFNSSRRYK